MRIKIISTFDGSRHQTRVVHAETGEEVQGVVALTVYAAAGGAYASLDLVGFESDIEAEATVKTKKLKQLKALSKPADQTGNNPFYTDKPK